MTILKTLSLSLALCTIPSFAGLNYNASKSNTGNVTDSCHNCNIGDGAAKGQANERTVQNSNNGSQNPAPASNPTTTHPPDTSTGHASGKRQH